MTTPGITFFRSSGLPFFTEHMHMTPTVAAGNLLKTPKCDIYSLLKRAILLFLHLHPIHKDYIYSLFTRTPYCNAQMLSSAIHEYDVLETKVLMYVTQSERYLHKPVGARLDPLDNNDVHVLPTN